MATSTATVINMVKTMLGAGMLALPFAFRAQGVLLGVSSLLFGAVTTITGLMLLAYASGFVPPGTASFFSVSKVTVPSLAVVFDIAIGLKCFGVCVSYLVIVGDLMPNVTGYFGVETSRTLWLILAMIVVSPIGFYRNLDSLKTASMIALSSVVYLVVIVVGHYFRKDTLELQGPISYVHPKDAASVISTVPIIVFAFTCAQNMFAAVNELENRSLSSIFTVCALSVGIATVVYLVVGLAGYLSFGDNVGDNVISMYSQSIWSTLGRLAIVILVLFSYPLMLHPARASVANVVNAAKERKRLANTTEPETNAPLLPIRVPDVLPSAQEQREHIVLTSLLLLLSFTLALTLNSLELILSFVGATGATGVSFILPGIFGYTLAKSDAANSLINLNANQKRVVQIVSFLLASWGCIVAVVAVGVNIYRLVK